MQRKKLRALTLSALLSAFVCVATLLIRIPTPAKGYVNLGDCLVNISAWLLGPMYGAAASAAGSALADILSGFAVYAPATLVIKGLMAVVSFGVFSAVSRKFRSGAASRIAAAVTAELVMVAGYFVFEAIFYGSVTAALIGAAANLLQGGMGVVTSVVIFEALVKKLPKIV